MKKIILVVVTVIAMLAITGFYSKGDASEIYGCYKKNNGQLRIVDSLSKCHPSENPIILGQPSGSLTAKLACVTASMGNPTESSADIQIENQKNININDWSEVFNAFYLQPDPFDDPPGDPV